MSLGACSLMKKNSRFLKEQSRLCLYPPYSLNTMEFPRQRTHRGCNTWRPIVIFAIVFWQSGLHGAGEDQYISTEGNYASTISIISLKLRNPMPIGIATHQRPKVSLDRAACGLLNWRIIFANRNRCVPADSVHIRGSNRSCISSKCDSGNQ